MTEIQPGIYEDVPFATYCDWDAVNISRLSPIAVSPKHYHAQPTRLDTKSLVIGRAAHSATFELDRFALNYTVWRKGRRAGKVWDAFVAANADKSILNEKEYDFAMAIRTAVLEHPISAPILQGKGSGEVSICWRDLDTGILCKGRLDWLPANRVTIYDLKTARSLLLQAFVRACEKFLYYIRAAFYCDGLAALIHDRPHFEFIAVENVPPHDVAVYAAPGLALQYGRQTYKEWLHLLADCQKHNTWPGIAEDAIVEQPCNYIDVDGVVVAT